MRCRRSWVGVAILAAALCGAPTAESACCYFSAQNNDVLQPSQKVFLTWDPDKKTESFTVQPRFEGNALDFGMVIPTPSQPKLDEMPRDFFKHLAVYSILKKVEYPSSKLFPEFRRVQAKAGFGGGGKKAAGKGDFIPEKIVEEPPVKVLEAGVVGSLDYKIIEASRADALFQWLKDNKYIYSGDEATLGLVALAS